MHLTGAQASPSWGKGGWGCSSGSPQTHAEKGRTPFGGGRSSFEERTKFPALHSILLRKQAIFSWEKPPPRGGQVLGSGPHTLSLLSL